MEKRCVVSKTDERVTYEKSNSIAKSSSFKRFFDQHFGMTIFPPAGTFKHCDAPLYVSKRKWMADEPFVPKDSKYQYEEYLDFKFWNENPPICFLVGSTGTGKSTLLDFYLRCYCPTMSEHQDRFREKLVISIDAKGIHAEDDFLRKFFIRMRDEIIFRCASADYPIKGFVEISSAAQPVEWVDAALKHLSVCMQHPDADIPFRYIVLVIDNLDQTSARVQLRALTLVKEWLEQGSVNPYRIYIPVWPETLESLFTAAGDPIPQELYETIQVGGAAFDAVVALRVSGIAAKIRTSAVLDVTIDTEHTELPGGTIAIGQCERFVNEMHSYLATNAGEMLNELSSGNLRTQLKICENVLCSRVALSLWHMIKDEPQKRMTRIRYDIYDAMLTGKTRVYNAQKTGIANVYAAADGSVLLGLHLLFFLKSREQVSVARLKRDFGFLGHSAGDIDNALDVFHQAGLWHELAAPYGQVEILLHREAIHRYLELSFEPAFSDNAAVVTNIPDQYASQLCVTNSMDRDLFRDRVESTLKFLDAIKNEETEFVLRLVDRLKTSSDAAQLRGFLDRDMRVPALYPRAVRRYQERLQNLRTAQRLVGARGVTASWWADVLSRVAVILEDMSDDPYWNV